MNGVTLVVVSPLKGFALPSGDIMLTQKFVDGMKLYRELWDGPILHLCEPATYPSDSLDNVEVPIRTPEFDTICAPLSDGNLRSVAPKRSLVLASVGEQFNSISAICKEIGAPCVYVTEYNLRTRYQIISEYQRNFLQGLWGKFKQTQQEIAQRRALAIANGIQCNGLPTYSQYRALNPSTHLFFDSRTDSSMLATVDKIAHKSFELHQGRKLRLAFSGRLNLMKGVDDLLRVVEHLRGKVGDSFHLSICGDGEYAPQLQRDIKDKGLSELVAMRGTLDFKTELVPFITNETDIFVCCHRQGDPSCTYLETMACGVPIIGYANDAWRELAKYSRAGRSTPLGDPESLANEIAELAKLPESIEAEARNALTFASDHTFEKTFERRIAHLREVVSRSNPTDH